MRHAVKLCDNTSQDQWASLYITIAKAIIAEYGLEGKGVIREGVRRYAAELAKERKCTLLESGYKTNLETFFTDGFGFPCGNRCRKEWIRNSEQELFLNVVQCPYADLWNKEDSEIGRMFCEEYYPVLVHEGTSEKAQINLGMCLLTGRDNICRHSLYLRPANVSAEKRAECFPAFDVCYTPPASFPVWTPDYNKMKVQLIEALKSAALDKLGQDCVNSLIKAVASYATHENDSFIAGLLEV